MKPSVRAGSPRPSTRWALAALLIAMIVAPPSLPGLKSYLSLWISARRDG